MPKIETPNFKIHAMKPKTTEDSHKQIEDHLQNTMMDIFFHTEFQ